MDAMYMMFRAQRAFFRGIPRQRKNAVAGCVCWSHVALFEQNSRRHHIQQQKSSQATACTGGSGAPDSPVKQYIRQQPWQITHLKGAGVGLRDKLRAPLLLLPPASPP
jgi:hypothetical protein